MALVGWPMHELEGSSDDKLMQSLAGNAFSAFSVGVMLLGLVAAFDMSMAEQLTEEDL